MDARLESALLAKGPDYAPRTRHRDADGRPRYTNRLILEASPYLLQHAHNPVDWFPWCDEAFERARAAKRPVFLSIGYSTCHWCHVMEEESFEDESIAALLNDRFVSVKVDREERPDVDGVYMAVVQAMTGRGGWPMSLFLTPDREAFFAGTYFPPRAGVRGASRGFTELLVAIADSYAREPEGIGRDARRVTEHVQRAMRPQASNANVDERAIDLAVRFATQRFDPDHGGVRGAPKFPSSFPVRLLLRHAARTGHEASRAMAITTLERMRDGGMHDVLGGGFHRYSVDARWAVPHFEKMLYDNALLACAYLDSGEPSLTSVARTTLDYLLGEMRAPEGTFYSATDADSVVPSGAREEGYYFTFTDAELASALGEDDAAIAAAYFGVSKPGNFEGRSVLSRPRDAAAIARRFELSEEALDRKVGAIAAKLLAERRRRAPPLRDEKVIVAWNALVVSALARAAIVLGERRYGEAAVVCVDALARGYRESGRLPHLYLGPEASGRGFLDDYAFLANASIDVFELTSDTRHLDVACALVASLDPLFLDDERGGYFLSPSDGEALIAREKPTYDGAVPSGNSIAAMALVRLAHLTDDAGLRRAAERQIGSFASLLPERVPALEHFLLALDRKLHPPAELVVVVPEAGGALAPSARPFIEIAARSLAPAVVAIVATERELESTIGPRVPWASGKRLVGEKATAYLCLEGECALPTTDPVVVAHTIEAIRAPRSM